MRIFPAFVLALLVGCYGSSEPAVIVDVEGVNLTGCPCALAGDGAAHVELVSPEGETVASHVTSVPRRIELSLPALTEPEEGWTVFVWIDCGYVCRFEDATCCAPTRRLPVRLVPGSTVHVSVAL